MVARVHHAIEGHLGVARALIAAGADVNYRGLAGTPIKYAAFRQRDAIVPTIEQKHAKFILEIANLPRERRLREV